MIALPGTVAIHFRAFNHHKQVCSHENIALGPHGGKLFSLQTGAVAFYTRVWWRGPAGVISLRAFVAIQYFIEVSGFDHTHIKKIVI